MQLGIISADGRYIVYLGKTSGINPICTVYMLDKETGLSEVNFYPENVQVDSNSWVPVLMVHLKILCGKAYNSV